MYKVVLPDGQETVPVDLQTLAQWASEGRIHSETSIVEIESAYRFRAADHPYLRDRVVSAPVLVGTHVQHAALPDEPLNPWFSMWVRPRQTIRQIVSTNPEQSVLLLAALEGLAGISARDARQLTETMPTPVALVLILLLMPLLAILGFYLSSFFVRLVSSWFGGQAEANEVRAALAWSYIPYIWTLPLAAVGLILGLATNSDLMAFALFFGLVRIVVLIWEVVVSSQAVGEVEGFSSGKAFGVLFLTGLLMSAALLVLFLLVAIVIGAVIAAGTRH